MRLAELLAATALLIHCSAAQAAARQPIDLPAGRLGNALVALGRQTGTSIGLSDPSLASRRVPALQGRLSVEQALERLLKDTGARYTAIDPTTYHVRRGRAPATRREPMPVHDPVPEAQPLETIIVTATKRPVSLAHYPGTVSRIDGGEPALAGRGHGSEALVSRLPSISSTYLGSGRNKLFIRGIADSSFNGPTQSTVGHYLRDTRLNYNSPDPDLRLYDIAKVELLPGPQGTLYGAGSLGGILRAVPNMPELSTASGSLAVAATATRHGDPGGEVSGVLNLPLVEDRLGVRFVGYGISEGGFIDDSRRGLDDVNRTKTVGGRAMARAATDSGWTFDIGGAVQRIVGEDAQFADRDAPPLTRRSAITEDYRSDYLLADFVVAKSWGDMRLVSATGIVRQRLKERYDSTRPGEPATAFDQLSKISLLSSETRLSYSAEDGSGWLIGTSFLTNETEQHRALGPPSGPVPTTGVGNSVDEITLFGEGAMKLLPALTLTAGGRVTHSRLSGSVLDAPALVPDLLARLTAHRDETAFLPSFALAFDASGELQLFARYQEGFRPGGLAVSGQMVHRFESDDVSAVEGGLRYGLPGRGTFDLAASLAYTRWRDVQADIIDLAAFPTTANIGDGRIYTLDLKAGWRPLPGLEIELAGVVNDSEVTDPRPGIIIVSSAPLPNVARFNGRLGARYHQRLPDGGRLGLTASARYTGSSRLGIGPILGEEQGDWLEIDLGARMERRFDAFSFGITNLLDTVGNRFAMGSPFTLVHGRQITPLRPRTLRIGWERRF